MLKEGNSDVGTSSVTSLAEVEGLKQEKEMLKEELQQSRMTIDNLRTEITVSFLFSLNAL